jgi:tetratricopeptide (TPR) repeat protein
MDLAEYSDEELLEAGRESVKREQWPRATTMLAAYVERFAARGESVPASGLASYALCLGHGPELKRGIELCKRAQNSDPRNPNVYWCLAQLHLLARSRKNAIEAVERGLRAVPDNFLLLRMRKKLGVRQPAPIPFLDRNHGLNVRLGRLMHRIKGSNAAMIHA